jgi:hypothetical protein
VQDELPPRVLATGNPARPVKELEVSDGWGTPKALRKNASAQLVISTTEECQQN